MRSKASPFAVALLAALASCATKAREQASSSPPPRLTPAAPAPNPADPAPATPGRPLDPLLLVSEPAALAALEERGFSLADFLVAPGSGRLTNDRLARSPRFASLRETLLRDLELVRQSDRQAGVGVLRYPHRLFDARWLDSKEARFELAGVVNRFDRAPFHASSCGELRLVYRLSYETGSASARVTSRLPMTLGLELPITGGDCARALRRWVPPSELEDARLPEWLTSSGAPLDPALVRPSLPGGLLVVNVQQVRWPSTVRPDLGGHAEYLLRAFRLAPGGERFQPSPLENTPDTDQLAKSPALRRELVEWLAQPENLAAVDRGTALLPERFLATRAISVTPRGLSRRANRPFRTLFKPAELAGLDYEKLALARSPEGLLRRLDQLSCQGCHEARSVAGFHLLGDDPGATPDENALASGRSPHLNGELERRARLAERLLAGGRADYTAPYAERTGSYSGYGAHCGLSSDPSFANWGCAPGLVCRDYDAPAGDLVGQCLPSNSGAAGDPCETGPLAPHVNPKRDRVARQERSDCSGSAVCNRNAVGFPGGMCTEQCGALSSSAVCGKIAILDPFNACVARGEPFLACLAGNVRPAGFRACDDTNPCRDDYVCARAGDGGACIPPYFLFQLRVDGHP